MALDIIKDIVDAEARADDMIKNAETEAASLKAEAEKKGAAILAETRLKAKKELSAAAEAAIEESSQEVGNIAAQAELDCKKLTESASKKMEEAITTVMRKVVGINGDS